MQMMRAPAVLGLRRGREDTYSSNSFGKSVVWCQKLAFMGVMLLFVSKPGPRRPVKTLPCGSRETHLVFPSLTSHPSDPGPASSTLL